MPRKKRVKTDAAGNELRPIRVAQTTSAAHGALARRRAKLQKRCIANASKIGSRVGIARASGVSRQTLHIWLNNDPEFEREFEKAEALFGDVLEEVVLDRVLHGTTKALVSMGKIVGYERQYDTRLTELSLKKRNKRYDDRPAATSDIAAYTGAAERLAAKLHLIYERQRSRVIPDKP